MGQAKNRGSREERIAAAIARQEALKPSEMICNECKTVITAEHIHLQDTRGIPGLDMVCGAVCPECKSVTWGFKGTEEAVATLAEMMQEDQPGSVLAVQGYKPQSQ